MARVTVEDCLENVDNRFELVLASAKRARQIANGVEPMVPWENDKPTVVALREMAEGYVGREILQVADERPAADPRAGLSAAEADAEVGEGAATAEEPGAAGGPEAAEEAGQ